MSLLNGTGSIAKSATFSFSCELCIKVDTAYDFDIKGVFDIMPTTEVQAYHARNPEKIRVCFKMESQPHNPATIQSHASCCDSELG